LKALGKIVRNGGYVEQRVTTEKIWGLADTPTVTLREGWKQRALARIPGLQLAQNFVEAGYTTKAGMHTHDNAQATYVLSGKFDVVVEGEHHVLGPGEGVVVKAETPHDVVCVESGSYLIAKTKAQL
jgi:quercetin dioxygenase-like cupin family protein